MDKPSMTIRPSKKETFGLKEPPKSKRPPAPPSQSGSDGMKHNSYKEGVGSMDKVTMLKGVIETYQNDFVDYEGEDRDELRLVILELIAELSRYVNNIRYCSNTKCSCSPESHIRRIMNQYGDKLDKMFFFPYGLCEVNMAKVGRELRLL